MEGEAEIDGRVRIPVSELAKLQFEHLTSGPYSTVASGGAPGDAATTGYTEWASTWSTRAVRLGWDWSILRGVCVPINISRFRTNIQLVSDHGSELTPPHAMIRLFALIGNLPWHQAVMENLRDARRF